jgi:uncharacterized phage protein (TIGR01671 family)
MREIKFRAWDKVDEVMREVLKIDFDLKVVWLLKYVNGEKRAYELEFDDIELMQFTGLHDKNGKEIYEGDIVKHSYPAGFTTYKVCFGEYDNGMDYEDNDSGVGWYLMVVFEHYYVEKWKERAYDKYFKNGEVMGILTYIPEQLEVIGNIYENKELLKEA